MPRRLWYLIHEPRIITAITACYWAVVTAIGVAALTAPPPMIAHQAGPILTTVWACFLLGGGVLGVVGCLPGWWWIERAGIIATGTGAVIYLATVIALHYQAVSGSRLVHAGFILLALISLVIRWLRIRGPQVDPSRGLPA